MLHHRRGAVMFRKSASNRAISGHSHRFWTSRRHHKRLPFNGLLTIIGSVRTLECAMSTDATLTSKGQTTIPKEIRDNLRMKVGDRLTFTLMPDGVVVMRVKNKRVSDLAGLLHRKGRKPVPARLLSR
jgi:antitoxin PrlF